MTSVAAQRAAVRTGPVPTEWRRFRRRYRIIGLVRGRLWQVRTGPPRRAGLLEHSSLSCSEPRASARADAPAALDIRTTQNRLTIKKIAGCPIASAVGEPNLRHLRVPHL